MLVKYAEISGPGASRTPGRFSRPGPGRV